MVEENYLQFKFRARKCGEKRALKGTMISVICSATCIFYTYVKSFKNSWKIICGFLLTEIILNSLFSILKNVKDILLKKEISKDFLLIIYKSNSFLTKIRHLKPYYHSRGPLKILLQTKKHEKFFYIFLY